MATSPVTRRSLLLRVRDPQDRLAWEEFVHLYGPLIHAYGRRRGLQDSDAADLAQEVLGRLMRAVPGFDYDAARGTFRGWLFQITRNELLKMVRKRNQQAVVSGDSDVRHLLEQQPDVSADESTWDQEYQLHLFQWAAQKVRKEFQESSWRAFWLTAVEGKEVSDVATRTGMTPGAIYIARSRIISRIRQEIQQLETE